MNADFLYKELGKDIIKVDEEDQSIPYNPDIAYSETPDSLGITSEGIDPAAPVCL